MENFNPETLKLLVRNDEISSTENKDTEILESPVPVKPENIKNEKLSYESKILNLYEELNRALAGRKESDLSVTDEYFTKRAEITGEINKLNETKD